MKFNEFVAETQDNGILVARVASGHSFCGEKAEVVKVSDSYVTVKTESGKRLRVDDVYGKAAIAGKYGKECFVAPVSRMEDENFFANTIF